MTAVSATPATQEKQVIANFGVIAFTLAPTSQFDTDPKPTILEIRFSFGGPHYRFAFQQIMADEKPLWAFTDTHPVHQSLHLCQHNSFYVGKDSEERVFRDMKDEFFSIARRVGNSMATDLRQSMVATITMKTIPPQEYTLTFTYTQSVDVTES